MERRLDQCQSVSGSSDGSGGVLFFKFPDDVIIVMKSSSNNGAELYSTMLARVLRFHAPQYAALVSSATCRIPHGSLPVTLPAVVAVAAVAALCTERE